MVFAAFVFRVLLNFIESSQVRVHLSNFRGGGVASYCCIWSNCLEVGPNDREWLPSSLQNQIFTSVRTNGGTCPHRVFFFFFSFSDFVFFLF